MKKQNEAISDIINRLKDITAEEKKSLLAEIKKADENEKTLLFKLERSEKDKATLRILLEESINDLQKKTKAIEQQNRELEIAAALDRVRARAMSMQHSDELAELVSTVFKELTHLDFILTSCIIWINNPDLMTNALWVASTELNKPAEPYFLEPFYHSFFASIIHAWKEKDPKWIFTLTGDEKKSFENAFFKGIPNLPSPLRKALMEPEKVVFSASFSSFGALEVVGTEPLSDEKFDILHRFGRVFDLSYTRFNDLKKAEAQAKEARIEAALERVRSKSMAMHNSHDMHEVITVINEQLQLLGFRVDATNFVTDFITNNGFNLWMSTPDEIIPFQIHVPHFEHRTFTQISERVEAGDSFLTYTLPLEEKNNFFDHLFNNTEASQISENAKSRAYAGKGMSASAVVLKLVILTVLNYDMDPYTEEENAIIIRFGKVFEQSYTRFLDLQKAEAQAREAKIETALERVRARALAMQQPEELKEVAQVLRREMGLLGVEELETCSIYIYEKDTGHSECWYAIQDPNAVEKKMIADHFALRLEDTWVGREMQKFYRSDENHVTIVMKGENRKEWIEYCYKHSPVFSGFYGETIPDRSYHLYKFSHGAIGAASPGEISEESWRMLTRAASVFSLAYSRFRDLTQARIDLQNLKEEKKKAEDALKELKAAQAQLIQAEKMASLGELTAGIAHEIQNPLNFVNNFSEVSAELLEEMKAGIEKGDMEDIRAITEDIKQNLEKINHHGKRADAIVKGMLQHSRISSGQKELTDINVLADEYLRLAYHGLKAKDKSFNARFESDFDPLIEKMNIIPQDIGRVILNLINNAFYAVNEKKQQNIKGYEPLVHVSTKQLANKMQLRVRDNGKGIPDPIKEKIFQPFFTTKPSGQGTGLGLSLSYDIIKAHGGEFEVETTEGVGSEFIITLGT